MRMFPSLVNCCTINWIDPWPENALLSVGTEKMSDLTLEDEDKVAMKQIRTKMGELACKIHTSAIDFSAQFTQLMRRKVYVTPKNYIDTISMFYKILKER